MPNNFTLILYVIVILAIVKINTSSFVNRVNKYNVSITVTSYNIKSNYDETVMQWKIRKQFLKKVLNILGSDIYCLQELSHFQVTDFKRNKYEGISRGRDIFGQDEALGIFWKKDKFTFITKGHFWLSNFPSLPGSKYTDMEFNRIVLYTIIKDKKNSKYLILNVHLDSKAKHSRYSSAELIVKMIDNILFLENEYEYLILCGDFNELPSRIFKSNFFKFRSFVFLKILNFFQTSYHEYGKIKTGAMIDFIYLKIRHQNNRKIILFEYTIFKSVLTLNASDHFPITMKFSN